MTRLKQAIKKVINGRRGAFQLLFAIVFLIMGLSYTVVPSSRGRELSLQWIAEFIPLPILGLAWIIGAGFGLWGSRRPRPKDHLAWGVLTLIPVAWGGLYFGGGIATQNFYVWLTSLLYWVIAGAVMVASGMQGDTDRDERETREVVR